MSPQSFFASGDGSRLNAIPMNLGWIALVFGIISLVGGVLSYFGVFPKTDYPLGGLGIAMVVGGYLACFIIPPLHRRVAELEQRLKSMEDKRNSD